MKKKIFFIIVELILVLITLKSTYSLQQNNSVYTTNWYFSSSGIPYQGTDTKNITYGIGQFIIGNWTNGFYNATG